MTRKMFRLMWALMAISAVLMSTGCAGVKYDAVTIANATSVNKQLDALADKSTTDFSANTTQIQQVKDSLQAAIAHEKKRGKTNITAYMWTDINKYFNNQFLATWQKDSKFGQPFVNEIKKRFDEIFKYITDLENHKAGGPDYQK
ncbi:MAG TPA: hypothetical protein VG603_10245 [Chitinophagales bacterium]|nr:hypothetical protein [Chitinophagales bacterium]